MVDCDAHQRCDGVTALEGALVRRAPFCPQPIYSFGAIFSAASLEVITG
jgi:hypothetical protein